MARSSVATSARRLRRTFPRIDVSFASRRPIKMARSCPHAEHHRNVNRRVSPDNLHTPWSSGTARVGQRFTIRE